jgi:hypothetical protein
MVNYDSEKMSKIAVVAWYEVLSQYSPSGSIWKETKKILKIFCPEGDSN